MTHLQQIVRRLADVSGSVGIHKGLATLDNGEQINLKKALTEHENDSSAWLDSPSSRCECGRDLDDCATAEGATFCMDRDEYVLFDCPRSYEEYLVAIEAEKETAHANQ